ncbi:MAG: hypothetical protein U0U67_15465 [Chitinophagales bacterium]
MKTINTKNKTIVFSFHKKVFLNMVIAFLTLAGIACKKEDTVIPAPITEDKEYAEHPSWTGQNINRDIRNTITGNSTYPVDIDNDGNNDFELQFYIPVDGTYSIAIVGFGNNEVVCDENNIIRSFTLAELINSKSKTWKKGANLIVRTDASVLQPQDKDADGYILAGIHFKKDNKMHYGWLRFGILLSRGFIHAVYLQDFVYEKAENKAIDAGRRNDV